MRKFKFKLQKVLEYRRGLEEQAKALYLEAKAKRLETELDIARVFAKRKAMIESASPTTVPDMIDLEQFLQRLDDEEHEHNTIKFILIEEEEAKLAAWQEKRMEAEVLEKLRQKALDEWTYESNLREQAALDEWAVTRRRA